MKAVKQWADVTTFHGIKDVIRCSSFWGKVSWTVLVLIFLILMALQLADAYMTYALHHWVTRVFEENTSGFDEYPTITICSYNRIKQSAAAQRNLSEDNLIYLFHKMPPEKIISGDFSMNDSLREAFIQWKREHNLTTKQIFEELSPQCDDSFKYIGHRAFSAYNCSPSEYLNITPVFTAEFGQCYQVNVRLPYIVYYPAKNASGKKYSLNILLKAHLKDYLNFSVANYLDEGFALQFQYGPKVVEWQWLSVAPGLHFTIGLRGRENRLRLFSRQDVDQQNAWEMPFSHPHTSMPPCAMSPRLKYLGPEHYSRETCLVECIVQPVVENCGCISYFDSPLVPMCEVEEYVACLELLHRLNITLTDEGCANSCEEPCFDRRIEASMSFAAFPPENQLNNLPMMMRNEYQEMNFKKLLEDYILIELFFEKLSVTVVEMDESFGFDALVSSYGGVMSLWAGASLLTVVQAAVYIIYGFVCGLGQIKKKIVAMGGRELRTDAKNDEISKPAAPQRNDHISAIDVACRRRSNRLQSSSHV